MRLYVTMILLGALVVSGVAAELLPKDREHKFIVSPDEFHTAFLEGQSLMRDEFIDKYAHMLAASNTEVQAHAAWALGRIQSAKSVEVLLSCRAYITNGLVLRLAYEAVQGQFSDLLSQSNDVLDDPGALLEELALAYIKDGYEGILLGIYRRVSGTEELREMFVRDITEMFDPNLTRVFLLIYPDVQGGGLKSRVELGILNCSGIDVRRCGTKPALSIIENPEALTPESIFTRYSEYFHSIGYMGSDSDVLWKVIMVSDTNIHRLMAYRALMWSQRKEKVSEKVSGKGVGRGVGPIK